MTIPLKSGDIAHDNQPTRVQFGIIKHGLKIHSLVDGFPIYKPTCTGDFPFLHTLSYTLPIFHRRKPLWPPHNFRATPQWRRRRQAIPDGLVRSAKGLVFDPTTGGDFCGRFIWLTEKRYRACVKKQVLFFDKSRGPESFQQCGRVSRSSGDRFPPLWMIFDDLHFWSLLNLWRPLRRVFIMIANVASELERICAGGATLSSIVIVKMSSSRDGAGQNTIVTILGNGHRGRWAIEQDLADSAHWFQHTFRVGILQTSLWRFCGSWQSCCWNGSAWGSAKILAAQVEQMALIRLRWLWAGPVILVPSGLDIIHTTWSTLTALVQYLCSHFMLSSPWLLESCWANLNDGDLDSCCPSMLGARKVVPGFVWSRLHGHSSIEIPHVWLEPRGTLSVGVLFQFVMILLVTCWHLSSSIFVPLWFSSGFLSNRLKLLLVTPLMFANSLWQKHGRQLKANSFSCPWYVYIQQVVPAPALTAWPPCAAPHCSRRARTT